MKLHVATPLALAMLAGMLFTTGCNGERDKLMALNRKANELRAEAEARARQLQSENEALTRALEERDVKIASLEKQVALLEQANADLQKALNELRGKATVIAPTPLVALPPDLDKELRDLADKYGDILEYLPEYGMVKLKSDLTFEKGSDNVSAPAKEALSKFADIMNSATAGKFNIYIAGHTDDIPIKKPETRERHPNNWYLSVHRAVAVEEVLAGSGLSEPRMGAMGFGQWHPIADNASGNKGNPANRRVELWIVPPERFLTPRGASISPAASPAGK